MKRFWIGIFTIALGLFLVGCVSPPPPLVSVPGVVGMTKNEACNLLLSEKLEPKAQEKEPATKPELEWIVYFQNPVAGIEVREGSIVTIDYYGEYTPPLRPQRRMSILWMGDEKWIEEYGGTHIVNFYERANPGWFDDDHPIKIITYFKTDDLDYIRSEVRRWKDDPNNGGYWSYAGHEPDITGEWHGQTIEDNKALRRRIYETIREEDPDILNHPVVMFYDMTGNLPGYPGWEQAFPLPEEGVDCDIFIIDCYANKADGTVDYQGLIDGGKLVDIGLDRSEEQFIPNLGAAYLDGIPASLVGQFEWWNDWYKERHDGESLKAVAFWYSGQGSEWNGIYDSEYLQEEAKKINRSLGLLE